MRAFLLALFASLLVLLVLPRTLRADVPPPNSAQCTGKNAGDTCTTDDSKAGACQSSTCSKLDYSDGTPPGTKTYPCLLCTAGAPSSTTTTTSTSTSSASATPTEGGSGCSVGFAARVAGAGGIALIVPAIVLFARRRRSARR
jgi:hypothetical protein